MSNTFSFIEFTLQGEHFELYSKKKQHGEDTTLLDHSFEIRGIPVNGQRKCILIPESNSFFKFRIKENVTYYLKAVNTNIGEITSPLKNKISSNNVIYEAVSDNIVTIKIQGFLGSSYFEYEGVRINFEIVPDKIDYENDYRGMIQDISDNLSQLLLNYSTPTMMGFEEDEDYKKCLLEQFYIIKNLFTNNTIHSLFGGIKQNPHSDLKKLEEWKHAAVARFDNFIKDPAKYGRTWTKTQSGYMPQEIYSSHKFISFDTVPNRFLKFALYDFLCICNTIIDLYLKDSKDNDIGIIKEEVSSISDIISTILSDPFFKEIAALHRIPFDNQTLQKKYGYKEILHHWLLSQLALKLKWEGRESAISASTRNVAELYEYWLYFKMMDILKSEKVNLKPIALHNEEKETIKYTEKGIKINLQEGKDSLMAFSFASNFGNLRIHFYYNRMFSKRKEKSSATAIDSYSAAFKPDYTLIIFPESYAEGIERKVDKMELDASADGRIAYIHFDAKYRVDKIKKVWGILEEGEDNKKIEENALKSDKEAKVNDTYKRGDLYKMHTYNEAIKKTVGSYVLYPGDSNTEDYFCGFHEVLPGVGAFTLKPGCETESIEVFLKKCFDLQADKFSQLFKIQSDIHAVIKKMPDNHIEQDISTSLAFDKPPSEISITLGFLRQNQISKYIKTKHDCFYFHAVTSKSDSIEIDNGIFSCEKLFIYTRKIGEPKKLNGWHQSIKSIKLIKPEKIPNGFIDGNASLYYCIQLEGAFIKDDNLNIELIPDILFDNDSREKKRNMLNKHQPVSTSLDRVFLKL